MMSNDRLEFLKSRLEFFYKGIMDAKLLAVTKSTTIEDILLLYQLGHRHFGENRVEQLKSRAEYFESHGHQDISWHFIGGLQSNKVNKLLSVPNLRYIHSVDRLDLLQKITKKAQDTQVKGLGLFLQVNTSDELEKGGLKNYDEVAMACNCLVHEGVNPHFYMAGLMTMGKLRTGTPKEDAILCFLKLFDMRKNLEKDFGLKGLELSMGMSNDYQEAVQMGSQWVRIGRSLFQSNNS